MPFVIATDDRSSIEGGSENPSGTLVKWYYLGNGKWTKDIGRAQRMNDEDAAMTLVRLKDTLPRQKFSFIVVDQLPIVAELAAMDPAEISRLRKVANEFRDSMKSGYEYGQPPPIHEPRIYKIGEKQCLCKACVKRLLDLFPDIR
jgi:hypothetical protein